MDLSNLRERLSFVPFVSVSTSNLGGHSSYFIHLSLDPKDTWSYNIFHNSRYSIFSISDGKIEQLSCGSKSLKFRKSNAKDLDSVVNKIQLWFDKVK